MSNLSLRAPELTNIFIQTGVSYDNMFLNNLRSDLKN